MEGKCNAENDWTLFRLDFLPPHDLLWEYTSVIETLRNIAIFITIAIQQRWEAPHFCFAHDTLDSVSLLFHLTQRNLNSQELELVLSRSKGSSRFNNFSILLSRKQTPGVVSRIHAAQLRQKSHISHLQLGILNNTLLRIIKREINSKGSRETLDRKINHVYHRWGKNKVWTRTRIL